MSDRELTNFNGLMSAEPLWKIAPTRDENGDSFIDFMMIIPKLKQKPRDYIERTLSDIQLILNQYSNEVVFANMNLKINCLWISHRPRQGLCQELSAAIRRRIPEAMLVADFQR
jgi:hypothetical protein